MRRACLGIDPIESVVSLRWAPRNCITRSQITGYEPRGFVSPCDNHP